jgi:hypothetical protein
MRDPHVQSLRYRVIPAEGITYDNPPPVEWNTDDFHLTLCDDIATLEMQTHYPSEEDARQGIKTHLCAWEMYLALERGTPDFRFKFQSAKIIDRDPPPPGSPQIIQVPVAVARAVALPPTVSVTSRKYPDPPVDFAISPDVETMWFLFRSYLDDHVRLTDMAYFCWTVVEGDDDLLGAAKRYSISRRVLRKLKELSSAVGTERTARKALPPDRRRPHTPQEKAWIEAAVKALIRRLGQYAHDSNREWPKVTMNDPQLPKLPHKPADKSAPTLR